MKIELETAEERKQVLEWAERLIESGAECTVEIGSKPAGKDISQAVRDVKAGKYGNYPHRKQNMLNAGFTESEYDEIMEIINNGG